MKCFYVRDLIKWFGLTRLLPHYFYILNGAWNLNVNSSFKKNPTMSLLSIIFLYGKKDSEVEFQWVIFHNQGDPICWWEAGLKGGLPFTKAQLYHKLEKMHTAFCLIIWKRQLAGLAGSLRCCLSVLPLLGLTWLPRLMYPISFQTVCRTREEC